MKVEDALLRVALLREEISAAGFPHEDCEKLAATGTFIRADLNTFSQTLWAFSDYNNLRRRTLKELVKDRQWFEWSFFERFPAYVPIRSLITRDDTPNLYRVLELNENLRKALLTLLAAEINQRNV